MKNDLYTFYTWCKENGYNALFDSEFDYDTYQRAVLAFDEARQKANCRDVTCYAPTKN